MEKQSNFRGRWLRYLKTTEHGVQNCALYVTFKYNLKNLERVVGKITQITVMTNFSTESGVV